MQASGHIVVSTVFSSGLYLITKSPTIAVSSFAIGTFLDIDHLLDYWKQHPLSTDISHFVESCYKSRIKTAILFLHSYELFAACAIMAFLTKSHLLFGLSLGYAQHLFLDTLTNPLKENYLSYFIIYRWYHDFHTHKLFEIDDCNGKDNNI